MQKLKILWYKLSAKIVSTLVNLFASQSNFDIENTILLVGSARSGTTFLMESLNDKNDYRIIFEPFNPTYTKEWKSFSARHYINPENVNQHEKTAVDLILKGKINNSWVDQYNRKFRSNKRLIKSVRANLLLDHIEKEYPPLKIVYLHRDPYDVVASRINLNFDPKDVDLILKHELFLSKYYVDIDIDKLKALLTTPVHCHAALWCFENRFLLQNIEKRNLIASKYEDIIGKTITLKNDELKISDELRRPSVTSSIQKSYQLSETERKNIGDVLAFFGMKDI